MEERAARTEAERKAAEAAQLDTEAQTEARAKASEERGRERAAGLSAGQIRAAEELASWEVSRTGTTLRTFAIIWRDFPRALLRDRHWHVSARSFRHCTEDRAPTRCPFDERHKSGTLGRTHSQERC